MPLISVVMMGRLTKQHLRQTVQNSHEVYYKDNSFHSGSKLLPFKQCYV